MIPVSQDFDSTYEELKHVLIKMFQLISYDFDSTYEELKHNTYFVIKFNVCGNFDSTYEELPAYAKATADSKY